MIKELIGSAEVFRLDETETMGVDDNKVGVNVYSANGKGQREFLGKAENAGKFINREENAKELVMWELIVKENIMVLENYIMNVELIAQIFENKPYHTASWVVNFHK